MGRSVRWAGAAVLVAFACVGCAFGGAERTGGAFVARPAGDGVQRATIVAGNFFFSPSHVTVKAGLPVELSVRRVEGLIAHRFVIQAPEAGIEVAEKLGTDDKVLRFTPSRPGSYEYFCDRESLFVGSHRERGMRGTLEVVP